MDISLLLIKPEVIGRIDEIIENLQNRGYSVLQRREIVGWQESIPRIYEQSLTPTKMQDYVMAYKQKSFPDKFVVIIVSHKEGHTIERLMGETGHPKDYQTRKDGSLRRLFGLPAEENVQGIQLTATFNGFHKVNNEKELEQHLKMFNMSVL